MCRDWRFGNVAARAGTCFVAASVLGCAIAWLAASPARAQPPTPTEYQIKAAFLYNFARFVTWPTTAFADSASPFVFGILGSDPFGAELDEAVKGHEIEGRPVRFNASVRSGAGSCQLLFVGASEAENLSSLLAALRARPILTVADILDFARQGGHIQFVTEGSKVRFEINVGSADRARLKIGSKLLRLATVVHDGGD